VTFQWVTSNGGAVGCTHNGGSKDTWVGKIRDSRQITSCRSCVEKRQKIDTKFLWTCVLSNIHFANLVIIIIIIIIIRFVKRQNVKRLPWHQHQFTLILKCWVFFHILETGEAMQFKVGMQIERDDSSVRIIDYLWMGCVQANVNSLNLVHSW